MLSLTMPSKGQIAQALQLLQRRLDLKLSRIRALKPREQSAGKEWIDLGVSIWIGYP